MDVYTQKKCMHQDSSFLAKGQSDIKVKKMKNCG